MSDIDTWAHLYGRVALSEPKKAADLLEKAGWKFRKAGFDEFDARGLEYEIYIEGSLPVLIHGPALDPLATAKKLEVVFRDAGIRYLFELYDSNRNLLSVITDEK